MLIFMLLNYDIAEIEKPDSICSPTFVVNDFLGLFLHPSIFYQRFKICLLQHNAILLCLKSLRE